MDARVGKGYVDFDKVALFVSVRYVGLQVQIGGHGFMANGRPERPKFANFHPGPFGGEIKLDKKKDAELIELLRERDNVDDHYQEVCSDEELSAVGEVRDKLVEDVGDKVVMKPAVKRVAPAAEAPKSGPVHPAPKSSEPAEPAPAKGPPGKKAF